VASHNGFEFSLSYLEDQIAQRERRIVKKSYLNTNAA